MTGRCAGRSSLFFGSPGRKNPGVQYAALEKTRFMLVNPLVPAPPRWEFHHASDARVLPEPGGSLSIGKEGMQHYRNAGPPAAGRSPDVSAHSS